MDQVPPHSPTCPCGPRGKVGTHAGLIDYMDWQNANGVLLGMGMSFPMEVTLAVLDFGLGIHF
jgi:hypothetical protein